MLDQQTTAVASDTPEDEGNNDDNNEDKDVGKDSVVSGIDKKCKQQFLLHRQVFGDRNLLHIILQYAQDLRAVKKASYSCLMQATDELRSRAQRLLGRVFTENMPIAVKIETALFNYRVKGCTSSRRGLGLSGKRCSCYSHSFRSLHRNLSDASNSLRQDVLSGAIAIENLVRMAPSELASATLKAERAMQIKMAQAEVLVSDELRHIRSGTLTDRFLCDRCKSRRSMYRFVYRNNSHHSSRIIVHCLECHHKYQHFGLIPSRKTPRN